MSKTGDLFTKEVDDMLYIMALMVPYYLEMSSQGRRLPLGTDGEALHVKKMEPLKVFCRPHSGAAREYPFMTKHTLLAPKLSNIPIRIPSGSVGTRQKGIVFLKRIINDNLLTPPCKHIITESDGSPPPKESASPSATDVYITSMPANSKYSSLVASEMCDSSSMKHSVMINIGGDKWRPFSAAMQIQPLCDKIYKN
jgi:hypothetical protein